MDFTFSDDQESLRGLAARVLADHAPVERVRDVEASDEVFDRTLWAALAETGLLAAGLPERDGGAGLGLVEACILFEELGRVVAPVPLVPTITAAAAVADCADAAVRDTWLPRVGTGAAVLAVALQEAGDRRADDPGVEGKADGHLLRLWGTKLSVPALPVADAVLVPARGPDGVVLCLVETAAAGVTLELAAATDRQPVAHLLLDGAPAVGIGGADAVRALVDRWTVGLCAVQVGICEAALRLTAEYTSTREQFDKPLSTFQGVALRAADAYIDTEAMRATMWQAAWRLDDGRPASGEVLAAAWWAAAGGSRVVHATQHLHGGMGSDVDYPVHRYFLWGKQIELLLGGASRNLARLGEVLAAR